MAAYGEDTGAFRADVAAQQQQVNEHLDVVDAFAMLRQAHAVNAHDALGARVDGRSGLERRAREARGAHDVVPRRRAHEALEVFETVGVFGDEFAIDHVVTLRGARIVHREERLAHAGDRGDVAARLHLVVLRRDARRLAAQHLDG